MVESVFRGWWCGVSQKRPFMQFNLATKLWPIWDSEQLARYLFTLAQKNAYRKTRFYGFSRRYDDGISVKR